MIPFSRKSVLYFEAVLNESLTKLIEGEKMDKLRQYAPVLHTGYGAHYTEENMRDFIEWIDAQFYAGFSAEGKSNPRTNDIDLWTEGFIRGIAYAAAESAKRGLELWLFDEWGYPTGTAGGKTLEGNTRWRSKKLHLAMDLPLEKGQELDLPAPPRFLSASVWKTGRDIFGAPLEDPKPLFPAEGRIRYEAREKRERLCVATWEFDNFRTVGIFIPDPEDDKRQRDPRYKRGDPEKPGYGLVQDQSRLRPQVPPLRPSGAGERRPA